MPLVSVLMSVFNGEAFLGEAVSSVLAQSFGDFELIVVNDASTDGSGALLRGWADTRLSIIEQPVNSGLVEALNLAASKARGSLLARMDADDVAHPHRLMHQVAAFAQRPALVLLGTGFDLIDARGEFLGRQAVRSGDGVLRTALLEGNQFGHPTTMMRADAFRAVGGYRALAGRFAQDYDLWLRLAGMGEIDNLQEALLRYRVHEGQISVDKIVAQREAAELYRQLALQRQRGGAENLVAARGAVKQLKPALLAACSAELLDTSARLSAQGQQAEARRMRWRALRLAPFAAPARRELARACQWRITRLFGGGQ